MGALCFCSSFRVWNCYLLRVQLDATSTACAGAHGCILEWRDGEGFSFSGGSSCGSRQRDFCFFRQYIVERIQGI